MATSEYLKLAITYLLENRVKFNTLAIEKAKNEKLIFTNYDFTNAYGTMLSEFRENLSNKIQKISTEKNLHNYGNFSNIKYAIGLNVQDYPLSQFLLSLLPEVDFYPQAIKDIIMEYSRVFNESNYKINLSSDFEIISLYFSKLLVRVIYNIFNDPMTHLSDIIELNTLTKQFGVEYFIKSNYASYHCDIVQKILRPKHENIKPIIDYLENYCKKLDLVGKKLSTSIAISTLITAKPVQTKQTIESNSRHKNTTLKLKEIKKSDSKEPEIIETEDGNNSDSSIASSASSKKISSKKQKDDGIKPKPKSKAKAKIPAAVRKIVWNTYIGKDKPTGKCLVCSDEDISNTNFECGHVKSAMNGGDITIENLRPICGNCNKSIGGNNMDIFMDKHKIKKPENWMGLIEIKEYVKDDILSKKTKSTITETKKTITTKDNIDIKKEEDNQDNIVDAKDLEITELKDYIIKLKRKIYELINKDNNNPLPFNPDNKYIDNE